MKPSRKLLIAILSITLSTIVVTNIWLKSIHTFIVSPFNYIGGYPAVKFSTETRSTRRVFSEDMEPGEIWIEPGDPEISSQDNAASTVGFQHIGNGSVYFDTSRSISIGTLTSEISPSLMAHKDATFLYVNGNKIFLLQIKSVNSIFLVFRLKEIPTPSLSP